ncbi:UDP-3-O-(3-hydroxymyristoyl)glucosamine N-acyltransferase [Lacibacterium aquatile]|uniref:UDP-3-O-acylglucosamine N-acyltransferase n=1 Tax=Lacibacterium aquatile TaxID=1168082 RepID=A0ABW5DMT9_9PROT
MVDTRFFRREGALSTPELAARLGAQILRGPERLISDVAALETAGGDALSYCVDRKHADPLSRTAAGAVLVPEALADIAPATVTVLIHPTPAVAFAKAGRMLFPLPSPPSGIHPSASVDPSAKVDPSAHVGPMVVVEAHAEIDASCVIEAGAQIGPGVVLGEGCRIGRGATVTHAMLGKRVVLLAGVRIGEAGFGFVPTPQGVVKIPQLGRVIIDDDVEVGANSTIDRGALDDTRIGAGTMIDNLVQIAHNVIIGRGCIIVAQVGISGSTIIEDYAILAGQVGVSGHLRIGRGAQVAAQSGVMRDLAPGAKVGGSPAVPVLQWHRQTAALERMTKKKGS